jgi:lipid-A-disaccharide synthase-like uncharacterized protein
MNHDNIWIIVGLLGQFMFFSRFFIQWVQSEIAKKNVFPVAFWYFSILGGALVLSYAVYRKDPVFIMGQATGLFIYIRNLTIFYQAK